MKSIPKDMRVIAVLVGLGIATFILGCSGDDSGLERRYAVTGRVTYQGKSVPKGTIAFEPVNPAPPAGRVASGYIENGSYQLTTATPNDGALVGEYKVVIASSDLDTSTLAKKTGGLLHQGDTEHQKALQTAKSPIPTKYAQSTSSPLTRKVEAKANSFDFDLTD